VKIRRMEPRDRGRVLAIVAATGSFTAAEIDTAREVVDEGLAAQGAAPDAKGAQGDYLLHVLEDDESRVAGYECHGPTPLTEGTYDLYWIAVDPACQGSGYGRALLAFAEADVRARGGRLLLIETSSQESYAATIRFYERGGYPLMARIKNFYRPGDDKLIFGKELAASELATT
jgi:ribosomal protein S18 acetylase RimI-like enzyme